MKVNDSVELPVVQVLVEYQSKQVVFVFVGTYGASHDVGGVPKSLVQFL